MEQIISRCTPTRPIVFLSAMALIAACASGPDKARVAHIMVVDARGAPIPGALVMPELEDDRRADPRKPTSEDLAERTSDAQGIIHADMRLYYWGSDDCFHFVVTREGYEDATFSVSRELFPPMLKIRMEAVENEGKPKPAPGTPAPPAK